VGYRIAGLQHLDRWRDRHAEDPRYPSVYEFLMQLVEDPQGVGGTPVPRPGGLPVHTAIVPGADVAVAYVVFDHPPYPIAGVVLVDVRDAE
jgi:hypothetical protein